MFKKINMLALVLVLAFVATACGAAKQSKNENAGQGTGTNTGQGEGTAAGKNFKAGMVTDLGGINDESFNAMAWKGFEQLKVDTGAKTDYLQSTREEDYIPNLSKFARSGYDITWGIGFKMEKAIQEVAGKFPDKKFGIVDSNLGGKIPANITSVTFKEHEGSFLMGVIAGLMTKSNHVGFIGGIKFPLIEKFEYGYKAGVFAVNPNATVDAPYANDFADAAKGKALAAQLYDKGADVIFHAAGNVGKGLFSEASERGKGFWAIGVDQDQYNLAPNNILSSMVKRVDVGVYTASKELMDGKFRGGQETQLGLAEKGVDIADSSNKNTPKDVLDKVEAFRQRIVSGEIKVPQTADEFEQFKKSYK